ncbi:nuclear receptor-binding factor 2 isoform X2 [Lissotriton helveticus]
MEVMDSPLNAAHQQCRNADRLLATGKYEEAIACHRRASVNLAEALKLTQSDQALLSLNLQKDIHMKQQLLIREKGQRAKREEWIRTEKSAAATIKDLTTPLQVSYKPFVNNCDGQSRLVSLHKQSPTTAACFQKHQSMSERESDSLLYLLQKRKAKFETCVETRTPKDDKIKLEEQSIKIVELNQLINILLAENERLKEENEQLRAETSKLQIAPLERELDVDADFVEKSELWSLPQPSENTNNSVSTWQKFGADERKTKNISIPSLPFESPLPDLPPLELPEDLDCQLKGLMDN